MLNQRHRAAQAVANELLQSERDIETAIVHNANLTLAVIEGRKVAKLPLEVGQEALGLVTQASSLLVQARGAMVLAHKSLRQVQTEAGLDAFSYGDLQDCPPPSAQTYRTALAIVA